MLQTVLMFLAPPPKLAGAENQPAKRPARMATRARLVASHGRNEAGVEGSSQNPGEDRVSFLTVVGNALGFLLLMTGSWLVLRLAETLLT